MKDQSRTAIVTGAAQGIGAAIALALLETGVKTAFVDRMSESGCDDLLSRCSKSSTPFLYVQADIRSSRDREAIVDRVTGSWGRVDVLVNNAGIAPAERRDILECTESSYQQVMDTNLKGTFFLTQLVANSMIRSPDPGDHRCIITVTSSNARAAAIDRAEYSMSKAALSMTTKLWATRLAEHGIAVYEIRPGLILTDMTKPVRAKYDRLIESGFLLQKRWGQPQDVARAVRMLVAGELPYSTGQILYVDGGQFIEHF